MKKNYLLFVLVLLFLSKINIAQHPELDKKLNKVYDLAKKGKLNEADKYLSTILNKSPEYGKGWEVLCRIRNQQYENSKISDNILNGNFTITTKDKNGKVVESKDDTLINELMKTLEHIKPSKTAYDKYIYTLKKSTLFSNSCYENSIHLRSIYIDKNIDSNIRKTALKYFNDAEKEFRNKNYFQAANYYKKAIEEEPNYYKANLYLGDCYYSMQQYVDALNVFKDVVAKYPNLLEPRKYLTDALMNQQLYEKAYTEAIKTITVYPDMNMFVKIQNILYYQNKKLNIRWTPRMIMPNRIGKDPIVSESYNDPEPLIAKNHWLAYKNAKTNIESYCNNQGIINQNNSLTTEKYLEVYSWKEMIKACKDNSMDEAKKMEEDGYLDCYVLITCFHIDIYDQFIDFASKNPQKIEAYFNKYSKYN